MSRDTVHGHVQSGTIDQSRHRSPHGPACAGASRAHRGTPATVTELPVPMAGRENQAKGGDLAEECARQVEAAADRADPDLVRFVDAALDDLADLGDWT